MVVNIKISGLNETIKFLAHTPDKLDKEIIKKSDEFMKFIQKSAILRAPRYTGFLADQIRVYKKGKNEIIIDTGEAYYAYYQEMGFAPHIIPLDYLRQHMISPNIPGQFVPGVSLFRLVSKSKPFILPALNSGLLNLPVMLKAGLNSALKGSRR